MLEVIGMFYSWSGLKINLGKTNVTIFGRKLNKPKFVEELKLKWCQDFMLLGIYFNVMLTNMQKNFEIAVEKVKMELRSWKFRFLTVFGKLTVIKTLCLPKLNHIVTVVPNPNLTYINELECEFRRFIHDNNPPVVDDVTRHMSKK